MTELWERWVPFENVSSNLDLVSFLFDAEGVFIRLRDLNLNYDFELKYESVLSIRNTDEGRRLNLLSTLSERYGDSFYKEWSIFRVQSSEYIKWLNKETYGIYEHYEVEHHVYITSNDILEIVTSHEPTYSKKT